MTRLSTIPAAALLVVLAGCGAQQAIKHGSSPESFSAATHVVAPSTSASASTAARPLPPAQALVTDEAQSRLLVVDVPDGHIAQSVPLPPDPEDIAATPNGGVAVVVSSRAGDVTVLRRDNLRTIKTFGGFDEPHIAAITPDGAYAYVTDDARGTLTAIRLSDMKVTATVRVGAGAHHLAISPNEQWIWVALGETAHEVTILSTVTGTGSPGSSPVVDPGRPRIVGHFTPGFPAHDLSFSPSGRQVWISSAAGRQVTVLDARTRQRLFRVSVGPPPQHLALEGDSAYLTSGYGQTIEKVNAATGRVITRATAPYGSFELSAADGYVTTTSLLRGTLAIYTPDLRLLRVRKLAPATREVAISRP